MISDHFVVLKKILGIPIKSQTSSCDVNRKYILKISSTFGAKKKDSFMCANTGPILAVLSPAPFQNIFKFCTFLPTFSNILSSLALFALFLQNRTHELIFQKRTLYWYWQFGERYLRSSVLLINKFRFEC